jgi:AcrR family transcriptional regulator
MNAVSTKPRTYHLRARAERQQETRQRIVEATAALHAEVGPARTTIADVARRAGVQRLTVYNHFPELRDLIAACSLHFVRANPPPRLAPAGGDPLDGVEHALTALYGWYRANEAMERNVHHDRHLVPELDELLAAQNDPALDAAAAAHAERFGAGSEQARALIRVALEFRTWEVLERLGLSDGDMARLFKRALERLPG